MRRPTVAGIELLGQAGGFQPRRANQSEPGRCTPNFGPGYFEPRPSLLNPPPQCQGWRGAFLPLPAESGSFSPDERHRSFRLRTPQLSLEAKCIEHLPQNKRTTIEHRNKKQNRKATSRISSSEDPSSSCKHPENPGLLASHRRGWRGYEKNNIALDKSKARYRAINKLAEETRGRALFLEIIAKKASTCCRSPILEVETFSSERPSRKSLRTLRPDCDALASTLACPRGGNDSIDVCHLLDRAADRGQSRALHLVERRSRIVRLEDPTIIFLEVNKSASPTIQASDHQPSAASIQGAQSWRTRSLTAHSQGSSRKKQPNRSKRS
ncbi:hypothetical protein KM043_001191 [Ampulex compressa]|nr:hypothetical protein KM043_001191 [Ampulex compressa]